jgi:phosphohistidine swiveling domain-containing protein
MKKYGHLRPGTYDVLGIRYDQQDNFFNSMQFSKPKKKSKIKFDKKIDIILKNQGLNFDDINFLNFFQESHAKRETLKFEFSKNLSDAIEFIVKALGKLGFSRDDISNLDINTIFDSLEEKNIDKIKLKFTKKISTQKKLKQINDNFILPPIIFSKENFDFIEYYSSKPNFITNKKITSNIIHIKNLDKLNLNLKNKIVLLQNADPGFDWIFTQNPSGLITEYGGVASHMAIRCAELGLPASIGCGQLIFQKLIDSNKVLLDCENKQIIILKSSKIDEYVEVKKTLRSLGYIK